MRWSPEAGSFARFLARARRRARGLAAARGAALGLAVSAMFVGVTAGRFSIAAGIGVSAALVAAGTTIGAVWPRAHHVARTVERQTPHSRNLILTAAELLTRRDVVPDYVLTRVFGDASTLAMDLDLRRILPARAAAAFVLGAVLAWSTAIAVAATTSIDSGSGSGPSSETAAVVLAVDVEIAPPDYTGRAPRSLRDPARIEAIAGSRIVLTVVADAASVTLVTIGASETLARTGREFSATVLADADGYLALAPRAANGTPGVRRLIGLSVTPDHSPRVRITVPGRDMLLPNGQTVLPLTVDADDDLGLATVRLLYTRVTGSGENFTFNEGEVPLDVTRTSDRAWTARGSWALAALGLEPGDMVIYRGVATDRRPGAPPAESETFIVEIAAPGALPGEGFAIDDRENKYAISQQMVILKTERLLAARASMPADEVRREAESLAAEQRQVRAEFVFMMGGELADAGLDATSLGEEHEAAGEDDLAAGRLANQGRADLLRAIRSMSRAAAQLGDADLRSALPTEKEALTYLQRAFSRSRYILRTLGERERLDLSRRLTGVLAALARPIGPAMEAPPSPRVVAVRAALADVATLAADPARASEAGAARAARLAERILQIDPAAAAFREAASALTRVVDLIGSGGGAAAVQREYEHAAMGLAAIARSELPAGSAYRPDPELDALAGALADALRQGRGSR